MKPTVTVLIPAYNAGQTLVRCLDSILLQTYANTQILLLNDGSTDNTKDILLKYESRISSISLSQNSGRAFARNFLLKLCKTEFGAHCDADDYMHPERIERQMEYMQNNPSCNFCCTLMQDFPIIRNEIEEFDLINSVTYEQLCLANEIPNPTVLFRTEIAKQFTYNENAEFEDWDYWQQIYKAGQRVECISKERLYYYNVRHKEQ